MQARATHGAWHGTWYYEVRIARLGETGHCRLGWSTRKGELQAPVGYDMYRRAPELPKRMALHSPLRAIFSQHLFALIPGT